MQLSKATIAELGDILKEEYDLRLSPTDLEQFAYKLVGFFTLLGSLQLDKFGNRSDRIIVKK